eukprot:1396157-Rhodomonas_salina.1
MGDGSAFQREGVLRRSIVMDYDSLVELGDLVKQACKLRVNDGKSGRREFRNLIHPVMRHQPAEIQEQF